MEKQEAAEFLGVSTRTLERLAAAGRLTKGRARRKTRPVVTFNEEELRQLKTELSGSLPNPSVFGRPNAEKPKQAIGFRLDSFYISRLESEGAKHGLSASEFARKLVIQGLEDQRLEAVQSEVRSLREGLADTFYAFLVMKCEMTEAEADEFVKLTILKEGD